jgi:hypothetical protein
LGAYLKDDQTPIKLAAAVKGAGRLFTLALSDKKIDKWADSIDEQLKQLQDKGKDKGLEDAISKTRQSIKEYREQSPLSPQLLKHLLDPDREQWKRAIKLLAASNEGMRVLGSVVEDYPDSAIAGVILKEW